MSTDVEWEKWGSRDPYFGVLTHARFRSQAMTAEARDEFFAMGRHHVQHMMAVCRAHLDPHFAPKRALDFGCGVGRVLVPLAEVVEEVVGVDISPSMLSEARRNLDAAGSQNVRLLPSDDRLSAVDGRFDLVHTCIVIQHIEVARGLPIFAELVERVAPGGIGALHVAFAWDAYASSYGVAPQPVEPSPWRAWTAATRRLLRAWLPQGERAPPPPPTGADPEMQMNFYSLSQLMFIVQRAGADMVHSQLTDHGGAIGAFIFFRRPSG